MIKIFLLVLSICASLYAQPAQVIAVQNESAFLEDARGHLWKVFDNSLREGDNCLITFSDNNTPNKIEDDVIIRIDITD